MFQPDGTSPFDQNDGPSPWIRAAEIGGVGLGVFAYHKRQLRTNPAYGQKLYSFLKAAEDRSPYHMFSTFGLADLASSYVPQEVFYEPSHLFDQAGGHTPLMGHLERLFGGRLDVAQGKQYGYRFERTAAEDAYLTLRSQPELALRVARAGESTGGSSRYGAPLDPKAVRWSAEPQTAKRWWENYKILRKSQHPTGYQISSPALPGEEGMYQPLFARVEGEGVSNLSGKVKRGVFGQLERMQRLMSDIGLGVHAGTYNQSFHIPFLGKGRGLVNEMLTKRALPVYLALGVGLPFLDYLTGHKVSGTALDIQQKASVFRAELTDKVPGLRSLTDTYQQIIPGAQYGPLALPLAGAFAGGLYHYGKVLAGKFPDEAARKLSARIFDRAGTGSVKLLKYFNRESPVAKGLLLGAVAMLPFVPGMLGSRHTASELQNIYSGEQPVPIRSGRWWEAGVSPWEGGRIKEWRPHWSVLWRTQAAKKSLYGSEAEYWKHHPVTNPIGFLTDPYYLEKKHYEDRPYPVTSPAFSNVPLIGPLLAATIGKLIKPVVRMHTDVSDDQYTLYSSRLEPKGPQVDSRLEAMVLQNLAQHGYQADTQVQSGKYRMDFVVDGGDGNRLAIEAEGASYHGIWNADKDAQRRKDLAESGWDISQVGSTQFFADPEAAMAPVYRRLEERGIFPHSTVGLDIKSGLYGVAPAKPQEEFSLGDAAKQEAVIFADFIGLTGFIGKTLYDDNFPDRRLGKDLKLQGSRQMDSASRSYYDRELGAGLFLNPSGEAFGYTEPGRRFVQREQGLHDVNEIPNEFANVDWMPGDSYLVDFKKGDPFIAVSSGFARLPGAGYEALHPEVAGLDPQDYPDINQLEILADIAPYSAEYHAAAGRVARESGNDIDLQIRYEQAIERVRQTRESVIRTDNRRFTAGVEQVSGTVKQSGPYSFELNEYPGRVFELSSVGSSAADLSALSLAENNRQTREQVGQDVQSRQGRLADLVSSRLRLGAQVNLTVPEYAVAHSLNIRAVVESNGHTLNQDILDQGLGRYRKDLAGPETQALFGDLAKGVGTLAEGLSFTGDESALNPMRYLPNPANTKLWQTRDPYSQYKEQEVVGVRTRRWQKPVHDFLAPYGRGLIRRVTGETLIPEEIQEKRDLNTLADSLEYLRAEKMISQGKELSQYTNQARRTAVGVDQFANDRVVASSLPDRDARYFERFLPENDPEKRVKILNLVSDQMAQSLTAQWVKQDALIASAEGQPVPEIGSQGRLYTDANLDQYQKADTSLGYGDYVRSQEMASFFSRRGYDVPGSESPIWDENIDYQDVKLKIIQQEGRDYHDFNIFDDRAALLWRKPYVDGAVRELTSADSRRSTDDIRRQIEQIMLGARNRNPSSLVVSQPARRDRSTVSIDVTLDPKEELDRDMRRNPEDFE